MARWSAPSSPQTPRSRESCSTCLKSLIGLKGPPGFDERSARPYVLAHLLIILLLEPLIDELEDSPRWAEPLALAA